MTKNKAHDARKYPFRPGERVLIDANVWLYLQSPPGQPTPGHAFGYSATMKNLLVAKARPITEALVLSEYLNRYLRIEYAPWKTAYPNFKDFRKSGDYRAVAKDAIANAKLIVRISATEDTPLSKCDLSAVLAETEAGTLDFNDGVLVESCRVHGWKLLTNDGDMTIGGIDVLTTNNKLLAACP
jgi:predicted nucleic acid-binding protein